MIPSAPEIARSMTGAWLLFWRDARGMALFDVTARGAWKSFFAAVLVAPLYVTLILSRDPGGSLVVPMIGYVVGWLAFPVVAFEAARLLGRADRYVAFVVATNWAGAIQQGLYLGVGLIVIVGASPPPVAGAMTLAALAVALAYGWFVIRTALALPGLAAAGLVALDFALGLVIAGIERGLVR